MGLTIKGKKLLVGSVIRFLEENGYQWRLKVLEINSKTENGRVNRLWMLLKDEFGGKTYSFWYSSMNHKYYVIGDGDEEAVEVVDMEVAVEYDVVLEKDIPVVKIGQVEKWPVIPDTIKLFKSYGVEWVRVGEGMFSTDLMITVFFENGDYAHEGPFPYNTVHSGLCLRYEVMKIIEKHEEEK